MQRRALSTSSAWLSNVGVSVSHTLGICSLPLQWRGRDTTHLHQVVSLQHQRCRRKLADVPNSPTVPFLPATFCSLTSSHNWERGGRGDAAAAPTPSLCLAQGFLVLGGRASAGDRGLFHLAFLLWVSTDHGWGASGVSQVSSDHGWRAGGANQYRGW